ncbi:MAG: hypothetical protein WCN88_02880 [Candidatus Falkowbacteria bacterium]
MTNLLTWRFWFALRPESLTPLVQKGFSFLLITFVAIAFFMLLAKKHGGLYRGFFKRLYTFFLSNAIIGGILLFLNYEMVPFFSARFWLGIWGITMIVWLVLILKKLRVIPIQKKKQEQDKELKKYLP